MNEHTPQDWIAIALFGFFADEGRTLTPRQKGDLAGRLVLACAGIQGDVDVPKFQKTVFAEASSR